jgi:hypothetical protein
MMNRPTSDPNDYQREDDDLRALLKSALPPVDDVRHRDLWPQMLARLESSPPLASRAKRVPWLDWVLAAAALALMLLFPGVLPMLLFHL